MLIELYLGLEEMTEDIWQVRRESLLEEGKVLIDLFPEAEVEARRKNLPD